MAGDPGTGVSGSTLGRCDEGRLVLEACGAGAGAAVMLGVNLCGSLAEGPGVAGAVATDGGGADGGT